MKKRFRRILLALVVLGVAAAVLFELETHVLRGWLRGEAFFDGRPTSYWRAATHAWIARFESPEDAENCLLANSSDGTHSTTILYKAPHPTVWAKMQGMFGKEVHDDWFPPLPLRRTLEAGDVLNELEQDAELRRIVVRARSSHFFQ